MGINGRHGFGVAILISNKKGIKTKSIGRDNKEFFIMINQLNKMTWQSKASMPVYLIIDCQYTWNQNWENL